MNPEPKRNKLIHVIPLKLRMPLRKFIRGIRFNGNNRYCVICNSKISKFLPVEFVNLSNNFITRNNAKCPICGSIERYRLIYLYIAEKTNLFSPPRKKMLHAAPELILSEKFQTNRYIDYLSSDIDPEKAGAMLKIDLTSIDFPDHYFDVILSSHVLEHIVDDKKAVSEIFRILKPGGWAIIQVPIISEKTFSDSNAITDQDRLRIYGKEDHVRGYGKDYVDLLESVGFTVKIDDFVKKFTDIEAEYLGLLKYENIYFCTKPMY